MEFVAPYQLTILMLGLTGFLFWCQLLIADITGIRAKHTPGFSVEQDHERFLFRANRAIANSNESVGVLILASAFAMLSSANAAVLNGFACAYFAARVGHMLSYYANLKILRSVIFAVSFVSLLGMFVTGLLAWMG